MLLIRQAELYAHPGQTQLADVRCRNGLINEIGQNLSAQTGETVIMAGGGALMPGLHDHHIHLLALAATQNSVICGPPAINNSEQLQQVLKQKSGSDWIRGIEYHESIAGELDRWQLDRWICDRPLRIQHRSGILWILNSCAIEQLQLENEHREGLERNHSGQITGRLFRLDTWLRKKMGTATTPNLAAVSAQLAQYGITGVTDTSADNNVDTLQVFENAINSGQLQQRLLLMGNETLPPSTHPMIKRGAVKILLDEFQLPELDSLKNTIRSAHAQQRSVAFHSVTEAQLVFALCALQEAGSRHGDRIEHASLCPDEVLPLLRSVGVAIVTQPGLLSSRGSQYQREVPVTQHAWLYRGKTFLEQGIPLALSSDAPYGQLNPWKNMHTAIVRTNAGGYLFNKAESLSAEEALGGYLRDPTDLSTSRTITPGKTADLCLLKHCWFDSRNFLEENPVQSTICAGKLIYNRS